VKKRLSHYLLNADLVIAEITLALLILFTFAAVFMRYVVNHPVTWGEEFQLACIVLIVFFGAGAGFRLHSHVAIDFLVDLFPPRARKITENLIFILTIIILAYFFVHSAGYVRQMFLTERRTNILKIPYFLIYASFPISCVLMILNYAMNRFGKNQKEETG